MFLFYIDESGTYLKDKRSDYFVLGCLAIDATDNPDLDSSVSALKRRLISWAKPEDWEIKGRDLRRGENFFEQKKWPERAEAIQQITELLYYFPCYLFVVQVFKPSLRDTVDDHEDLYRLALWRLLEELELFMLESKRETVGMLFVDSRTGSIRSHIQDRRLLDAYQDWVGSRAGRSRFISPPWFGPSNFYSGLQLADFIAYLGDFAGNEKEYMERTQPLFASVTRLKEKVRFVRIP